MIHHGNGQNALKAALAQVLCETSCPNLCHSELHLLSAPRFLGAGPQGVSFFIQCDCFAFGGYIPCLG